MKTIPQNLDRKVKKFIFDQVEVKPEDLIDNSSNSVYIEAYKGDIDLGFTLDIEYNHNLELEYTSGNYFDEDEYNYTGYAEVVEIRVYTEDEEYELELTDKLKRELNFKF
jgi:hypothetical protein